MVGGVDFGQSFDLQCKLWVHKDGCKTPADFEALLADITERTGLPISLDGVYRWVVFLPSRLNDRVPVANCYFGVFQDGSLKVRGIEARLLARCTDCPRTYSAECDRWSG